MFFYLKKYDIISIIILILFIIFISIIIAFCYNSVSTSALPINRKTIIIDAGHGLPDGGAIGINGTVEQQLNLEISIKLQKMLEQSGAKVVLTRSDENAMYINKSEKLRKNKLNDLKTRKEIIDSVNADIFVSIHMNKFEQSKYHGAQVFYSNYPQKSKILAETVQQNIKQLTDNSNNRKIKMKNDIFLLKNCQIPSILIECGFLSNPQEEQQLNDDAYQTKIVYSIYHGILDYFETEKKA